MSDDNGDRIMPGKLRWPLGRANLIRLSTKKYRRGMGLYILEGSASILDALDADAEIVGVIHDSRALRRSGDSEALEEIKRRRVALQEVTQADLRRISGLKTPPPVLAVVRRYPARVPCIPPDARLILAVDRVSDPGNLGTLLRSAAFYGVKEVWLGRGTVGLYNQKVVRGSMAAHLHLRVCSDLDLTETIPKAKDRGCRVLVAVVEEGEVPEFIPGGSAPAVLILGSEPHGISTELMDLADIRLAIPRSGSIDSLNVAVAGTVLLDRLLRA